jgi:lipid A 3-O-deacylase
MQLKKTICCILILCSTFVLGQGKTTEIGIITDNDLYTSTKNDKYYTNGFELFYRFLAKNEQKNINKKILEFRIGQYIYNPRTIHANDLKTNDRPFAGYLFAEAGKAHFYQNESVLKADFQLGFIGANSFAEEVQTKFHALFNYISIQGWQHQIKNALAVQTHFLFSKKIAGKPNIDFHFQSEANLGTIFTGVSSGFMTRISLKKLVPIYDSNIHGASVYANTQQNDSEFYFYIAPSINYQLYDATIQGSLFNNSSPVTYDIIPFRFNAESGLKYRKKNLNVSYAFVYRGKELQNDIVTGYFYGSIAVSHLFK